MLKIFDIIVILVVFAWMKMASHALELSFDKVLACEQGYGIVVEVLKNISSPIACAIACSSNQFCISSSYYSRSKTCKLNNEQWPEAAPSNCTKDVIYLSKRSPICLPGTSCTYPLKNMRLCDGDGHGVCNPRQGRIEILHEDAWGTVCNDNWATTKPNAVITCRMLGYTTGTYQSEAAYGRGTGSIWKDKVKCKGHETTLFQCPSNKWGWTTCNHGEDVGVSCI